MSFSKLAEILKKLQARNPALSKRMEEADALSRWDTAVGPQIAKHARALRIQDAVLWIEVDHPIWKSELHFRKRQILEILNAPNKAPGAGPSHGVEAIQDLLLLDQRSKKP